MYAHQILQKVLMYLDSQTVIIKVKTYLEVYNSITFWDICYTLGTSFLKN